MLSISSTCHFKQAQAIPRTLRSSNSSEKSSSQDPPFTEDTPRLWRAEFFSTRFPKERD
ncbi:hypothetical protein DEO72_LG2g1935 [Vigna unguiculata]|uniref:Uncharacterized protein n=1 Tax=Vigna unguiculata TaxID=3917 RepID=A0A4D6KU45_VIGUN|nr:hypothetical protein DEO72_LG2g1935 [Vigna unguiculata]